MLTRLCDEALHHQTKLVREEVIPAGNVFREERVIVVVHLWWQASKTNRYAVVRLQNTIYPVLGYTSDERRG